MNNENIFSLNNNAYSNNNDILLEVVKKLENIVTDLNKSNKIDVIINRIKDIIIIINKVIIENQKNIELIRKDIKELNNNVIENFNKLKSNNKDDNLKDSELKYEGSLKDNMKEGKGILYFDDGGRYKGEFKKNKADGKGIMYYSGGSRYEGDFKDNKRDGKGIYHYESGSRYEGNLEKELKKEKEYIIMKMVIDMKGILKMIIQMEKE